MTFTPEELQKRIGEAEQALRELDARAFRMWERIRIEPHRWSQKQYPGGISFWVIGILGKRCLYFNEVECGWGWGRFSEWGTIGEYHWQQDEIQHTIYQTLFAIDNGGVA